jgi:transposase-like protein
MVRKKYSKKLKARIALDAIKGQKTIAELASEYGVHANQISLCSVSEKVKCIEVRNKRLRISRQCELLQLPRHTTDPDRLLPKVLRI